MNPNQKKGPGGPPNKKPQNQNNAPRGISANLARGGSPQKPPMKVEVVEGKPKPQQQKNGSAPAPQQQKNDLKKFDPKSKAINKKDNKPKGKPATQSPHKQQKNQQAKKQKTKKNRYQRLQSVSDSFCEKMMFHF